MHVNIQKVCIPTDFSETAEQALRYGVTLAEKFSAELHLLHVLQHAGDVPAHPDFTAHDDAAQAYFNRLDQEAVERGEVVPADRPDVEGEVHDYLRRLEKGPQASFDQIAREPWWERLKVVRSLRYGNPVEQICRYAHTYRIDLLVLGTHGRSGLKHFLLGSVAERVVRSSPCPTLTVRHPERDFVVPD